MKQNHSLKRSLLAAHHNVNRRLVYPYLLCEYVNDRVLGSSLLLSVAVVNHKLFVAMEENNYLITVMIFTVDVNMFISSGNIPPKANPALSHPLLCTVYESGLHAPVNLYPIISYIGFRCMWGICDFS